MRPKRPKNVNFLAGDLAAIALWIGMALLFGSQSAAQEPSTPAAADAWQQLVDVEHGYEITLPTGWKLEQTRLPTQDGGVRVLLGVAPAAARSLEIRVYHGERVIDFDRWCRGYAQQARLERVAVQAQPCAAALRPATRLSLNGKGGATEHLLVLADPMKLLVMILSGTDAKPAQLAQDMDRFASTLQFAAEPVDPVQTEEALRRGRALISVLRRSAEQVQVSPETLHYLIELDGKPHGYRTRRFSRTERDTGNRLMPGERSAGLQFLQQEWTFSPDGTARMEAIDAFTSFDGQVELLETRTVQIPPAALSSLRPLIRLDQCVREGDRLFSSVSRNLDQDLPAPRPPMVLDANYLSRAWIELLPGFLANLAGETHLFTHYDAQVRTLRPYLITSRGPVETQPASVGHNSQGAGAASEPAYQFDCAEEFGSRAMTRVWTSRSGALLRSEFGTQVVRRSTAEETRALFGARQSDAERRLYTAAERSKEKANTSAAGSD